jgi:hydrogenase-1 operon protein HyaE
LLDRLMAKHGLSDLDQAGFQAFMDDPGAGVVLLTDEPDTAAENWDTAVIFPELLAAMGNPLRAAIMRPEHARSLMTRFGLGRLPALLFLRDGGYVGAIEGLRDWSEYVDECAAMLQKPVSRAPSIGIAVTAVFDCK